MPEPTYPIEFEDQVRQGMAVPEPREAAYNALRARVMAAGAAHLQAQPSGWKRLKSLWPRSLNWKLAALPLAVLLLLALLSPQVVSALRSLFGYVPDAGLVDQAEPLLVLASPVSQERDGYSVTVEQAIATRQKTVVIYWYTAPSESNPAGSSSQAAPAQPALHLPDGTTLDVVSGRRQPVDGEGIRYTLEFGPLPANVTAATLELPSLAGRQPGTGPQDWRLPLQFTPADPAQLVTPVVEDQTAPAHTPSAAAAETPLPAATAEGQPGPSAARYGATVVLENTVELPDSYLLWGSLQQAETTEDLLTLSLARITDAGGQDIEHQDASLDVFSAEERQHNWNRLWAVKVPKGFIAPLTLEFRLTAQPPETDVRFQFDPGPNPHDGQTWVLNEDLVVSGARLQVVSAAYHAPAGETPWLELTMVSEQNVIAAAVFDAAHPELGGGSGGSGSPPQAGEPFTTSLELPNGLTGQPLTLVIRRLLVQVPGDWQITWSP